MVAVVLDHSAALMQSRQQQEQLFGSTMVQRLCWHI
jgi:hypothetical protein